MKYFTASKFSIKATSLCYAEMFIIFNLKNKQTPVTYALPDLTLIIENLKFWHWLHYRQE